MSPSPEFLAHYEALTLTAGFARLNRTLLALRGTDRATLLNSFCTNDIKRLQPGQGCEAFITTPQGKTLGHVFVFQQADEILLNTSAGQAESLITHFNRYIISEDVELKDQTSRDGVLLLSGEKIAPLIEQLAGISALQSILQSETGKVDDKKVAISRVPYAGANSFFLQAQNDDLPTIEQALLNLGARRCAADAAKALRLEAGFPLFGADITAENLPQECGRDSLAISFQKGCYLGQETVARLDALGHVNRRLTGLQFKSEIIPKPATPLHKNDKAVGHVTTAAWSPRLQSPLAFALVRTAHSSASTVLDSEFGEATVIPLPLQIS